MSIIDVKGIFKTALPQDYFAYQIIFVISIVLYYSTLPLCRYVWLIFFNSEEQGHADENVCFLINSTPNNVSSSDFSQSFEVRNYGVVSFHAQVVQRSAAVTNTVNIRSYLWYYARLMYKLLVHLMYNRSSRAKLHQISNMRYTVCFHLKVTYKYQNLRLA